MDATTYELPRIVSRDEWLEQRKQLLAKEKEFTRLRDELNRERRRLPMVRIEKNYVFETPSGPQTLADLFEGRDQLIIYHFMLDPDDPPPGKTEPWSEGCSGCSFFADNIPDLTHLHARHTSFALVSRAPLAKITPFKQRMGWKLPWVSSFGTDFNYDFHTTLDPQRGSTEWNYRPAAELVAEKKIPDITGELPGLSVFLRDGDAVYHTYSTYGRGLDPFIVMYQLLDVTPFGRGEGWDGMPDLDGLGMGWLRHRDKYDQPKTEASCCHCE